MKKPYTSAVYEVTMFRIEAGVMTLSSDRENAYVPSDSIWGDLDFDDDE